MCPVLLLALWAPTWILTLGLGTSRLEHHRLLRRAAGRHEPGCLFSQRTDARATLVSARPIPHLFAVNSVAGSLAVVLSFYLGIRVGYTWTVAIAFLLYVLASWVYYRCRTRERRDE